MSVQIFPDVGEKRLLQCLKDNASNSFKLRLFKNVFTASQSTVLSDIVEATFSGYPITFSPLSWNNAGITSNKGEMVASAATVFAHNGGGTGNSAILGYYITEDGGGRAAELISVEKFDASQAMTALGDTITITPKITLNSEN